MSASAQGSTATTKAVDDKTKNGEADKNKKPAAQLEEDDEFEDFPNEGGTTLQLADKEALQ